jgi:hypothetical protein
MRNQPEHFLQCFHLDIQYGSKMTMAAAITLTERSWLAGTPCGCSFSLPFSYCEGKSTTCPGAPVLSRWTERWVDGSDQYFYQSSPGNLMAAYPLYCNKIIGGGRHLGLIPLPRKNAVVPATPDHEYT